MSDHVRLDAGRRFFYDHFRISGLASPRLNYFLEVGVCDPLAVKAKPP